MIDTQKRRTLKWLSTAPLAAIPFASMGNTNGLPEVADRTFTSSAHQEGKLDVQIIDRGHVSDNTVLIHNSGTDKMVISKFTGGIVVFNNRMLDLNTLVAEHELVIAPDQTRTFDTKIWSILATPEKEYVYADHAVEVMGDATGVVRLGLYMFNDTAVVYAKPPVSIYS